MFNVMIYCVMMLLILFTLMTFLYFVSTKSIIDREKSSPFECGFDPFESSRIPFSSHFFMIAVIFLIFDVELVIIMPMIIVMTTINIIEIYLVMLLFLLFLTLGLYHEWKNNMLNWV
uniref:NADH-ubiquinone oxidoreductase chain 3 n=2 Tax=cassini group TaxID=254006 RepID=A0A3Q8GJI6_9HEMI|nr:NADH dehydrogenase subunit 3 [Magicicada cassinii]YP_009590103.1 NADH dehydrogenase subunit 3 [Magicicada tredecassini]AWV83477.1 NADH dehydrogenase subunit 3 [Magicicada cassinii]AWV83529.1 NADH dehydrogenase subunit 3 [Magicicada tredecassini]QBM08594.1 NADH dehydrogenase subunit 3 [Magicicada cassinii]QBM08607.1 NADH dehydrogenase subunit 3 [Magicicada cassinii]QBM08620.1 NADH dehydrogenase subunit 3 [Magicicada cassinii]